MPHIRWDVQHIARPNNHLLPPSCSAAKAPIIHHTRHRKLDLGLVPEWVKPWKWQEAVMVRCWIQCEPLCSNQLHKDVVILIKVEVRASTRATHPQELLSETVVFVCPKEGLRRLK
jgi:hypothetical protein